MTKTCDLIEMNSNNSNLHLDDIINKEFEILNNAKASQEVYIISVHKKRNRNKRVSFINDTIVQVESWKSYNKQDEKAVQDCQCKCINI